ncbi:MAG TPA: LptF/LptG family permease [Fimbriimonadaceae bacterium]|nr:LptF/LptG family permease [Fimbriimonadaceae bacterium]
MKRVDWLVIGELIGPWVFGIAIFTVIISAGQFLFQITQYLAAGANPLETVKLLALLMPGVMAKTFSMAVLLATLLAFGRLSGDSEIVALRAGGISLGRIMAPVAVFGLLVFGLAFAFNELIVPGATFKAIQIRQNLDSEVNGRKEQPTFRPIYKDGKLQMMLGARDFDMAHGTLKGVEITVFNKQGQPNVFFWADEMVFKSEQDWRLPKGGEGTFLESGIKFSPKGETFPTEVPNPDVTPEDLITQALKDLDALSMVQMKRQIDRMKASPDPDEKQVANLEFGYWNKIALPLAAMVFGLVGAPLGIRNHRAGTATGFALSVVIIFGYMMLANAMSIMSQGGRIPAYVASFTPIAIGLLVAIVLIQRRNK